MCKKFGIIALAVAAGVFVLSYTRVGSYAHRAATKMAASIERFIPMEDEIARISQEIDQLDRDTKAQFKGLADEIVSVETLKEEVATARANLTKMKDNVLALKKQVETGTQTVSIKGREVGLDKAKEKLQREFESYKLAESGLKSREDMLEAKEEGLSLAREQLGLMRQKKEELKATLAQLEAKVKALRVAETRNNFQFDESRLGHIKESINKLNKRLRSAQVQNDLVNQYNKGGDLAGEKKVNAELLKEIENHFGQTGEIAREPHE